MKKKKRMNNKQKFVFDETLEHVKNRKISYVNRGILYIAKAQEYAHRKSTGISYVFIRRPI